MLVSTNNGISLLDEMQQSKKTTDGLSEVCPNLSERALQVARVRQIMCAGHLVQSSMGAWTGRRGPVSSHAEAEGRNERGGQVCQQQGGRASVRAGPTRRAWRSRSGVAAVCGDDPMQRDLRDVQAAQTGSTYLLQTEPCVINGLAVRTRLATRPAALGEGRFR